jgi:hypothetical protein
VYGPFTHTTRRKSQEFWTPPIFSNEIRLEYYLPARMKQHSDEAFLAVDAIANQYRPMPGTGSTDDRLQSVLGCHLDATCYTTEGDGVGALTWTSSPDHGWFFCSGAMLNRVPEDFTPLFATARHCGGDDGWSQQKVDSTFVFWRYQTPSCNDTPPDPSTLASTSVAILLVDDANTDYTLFGLESNVPGGLTYEGWDANYWPDGSVGARIIHHPAGTHKRITFGTKTADETSCVEAWAYKIDIPHGSGEIEPGSSGAPVFDNTNRVRGTASCATSVALTWLTFS